MSKHSRPLASLVIALALCAGIAGAKEVGPNVKAKHRTDWFKAAGWGVFTHYLTGADTSVEEWNRRVNGFDVNALAAQLQSVGAKYYFITLGQNSGHYSSPNATYDSYVGIKPSKLSTRDLVADLYDALRPKGIKPLVYLPAGAPDQDPIAIEKLQWQNGPHRNTEFQEKWQNVIREWSLRWGKKVTGWWFDGCYWPNEMYRFPDPPNFKTFADAARAGNPDSIVAFNPGVLNPIISESEYEDYTAGEINEPGQVTCPGRWVDKAQFHMLSYLGPWWSAGPPRFTTEQIIGWTRGIIAKGGVVTWDAPIRPDGHIPPEFVDQLKALHEGLR
jgi:hypothetical protein